MTTTSARRAFLRDVFGTMAAASVAGPALAAPLSAAEPQARNQTPAQTPAAPLRGSIRITKLETFLVKPRWLFLKVHTDAGHRRPGRADRRRARADVRRRRSKEIEPYLVGKDPRQVVHHWQAIYRHAFYRGGPILTSALSGIDQALWDIKGKALGVPVYELLGGPTRDRVRVYAHARTPERDQGSGRPQGFTAFKTGPANAHAAGWSRYVETPAAVEYAAERLRRSCARPPATTCDIGIDFHGAISPADGQAADQGARAVPADVRRGAGQLPEPRRRWPRSPAARTCRSPPASASSPSGASARCWRSRRRRSCSPTCATPAASPKCRLIAGMAEAYYAAIAPHNPLGPISLAAGIQLAASIPNFLCQEQVSLGEGYLKTPFKVRERLPRPADRPGPGHRAGRGRRWPTRSATTGGTRRPTTRTTARWWIGERSGKAGHYVDGHP